MTRIIVGLVGLYSFVGTNDDKPHHFTQANYKEAVDLETSVG